MAYLYERVTDAAGNTINPAKEDGNLQTLANAVVANKVQTTAVPVFYSRSDIFVATGFGATLDAHTAPVENFAISVKGTGAVATAWTANLEASLDGTNFTAILPHTTTIGDGVILWIGALKSPALYFRTNVTALTLGSATNIVVTILGM